MSISIKPNSSYTPEEQVDILENLTVEEKEFHFATKIPDNLSPYKIDIFQLNLGKMCNQSCKHCHVDAGPNRKEIMTKETMQLVLSALDKSSAKTVDLTGGAPEMNPHFYWLVEELKKRGKHVIVRCNLSILTTKSHYHAISFYKKHHVEVISSLPFYTEKLTDVQRGKGVFQKSITALKELNKAGYGKENSGLILNLVYNPVGAYLPGKQDELEKEYKKNLNEEFNIHFNNLYTITNMPISRFLEYLINTDNYIDYMNLLIESFNPASIKNLMCRNTLSISWDGYLYDCDFNQMLDLKVSKESSQYIGHFAPDLLSEREIVIGNHCYGCTAGAGSSCGGSLT